MKKEAKVEFGIEITKPWSKEMYAHNDALAEVVKAKVFAMWTAAYEAAESEFAEFDELGNEFIDMQWESASSEMVAIQEAITMFSFSNQSIGEVVDEIEKELDRSATFRLKEIAEELEIELEKGFIGFN